MVTLAVAKQQEGSCEGLVKGKSEVRSAEFISRNLLVVRGDAETCLELEGNLKIKKVGLLEGSALSYIIAIYSLVPTNIAKLGATLSLFLASLNFG